jgi:hypothetical protein
MFYADSYHLEAAAANSLLQAKAVALEATAFYWISSTKHDVAPSAQQH